MIPNCFPEFSSQFIQLVNKVENVFETNLPKGLVHGDVFADNTVFNDCKLAALLDFDAVCFDYLLYDVGVAINGFCFDEDNMLNDDLLTVFLANYNQSRGLSEIEMELLPKFIQIGCLAMVSYHFKRIIEKPVTKNYDRAKELLERAQNMHMPHIYSYEFK